MRHIALLIIFLFIAGCARNNTPQEYVYYPACRQPILEVRDTGSPATGQVFGSTVIGVLSGAVTGLIFGGPRGAAVGMAAGAAGGAVTGAAGAAMSHGNNDARDNALLAKYLDQIDGNIEGLTLDQAAATVSIQCYERALNQLTAMVKAGQISKDAADSRFSSILHGIREAAALGKFNVNEEQLRQMYANAEAEY